METYRVSVPLAAIPLWVLAVVWLVSALFALAYWRSLWENVARPVVAVTFIGSLYAMATALLLSAATESAAVFWFRADTALIALLAPAALLMTIVLVGRRPPTWFPALWAVGIVLATASLVSWPPHLPLRRVPDGFWLAPGHETPSLLGVEVWDVGLSLVIAVIWLTALIRPVSPRHRVYAWLNLAALTFYLNDTLWVIGHRTPYPAAWITGLVFWGTIWYEVRVHVTEVRKRVSEDWLTGAASRGYGEAVLTEALQNQPVGVIYCDVDGFKTINDRFGHAAGDQVLREIAKRLKQHAHVTDFVMRLGGDEFAVVLPGATMGQVLSRLALLETEIAIPLFTILQADPPSGPVTVEASLGMAWSDQGGSAPDLITEADRSMYAVKQRKRSRSPLYARHSEHLFTDGGTPS